MKRRGSLAARGRAGWESPPPVPPPPEPAGAPPPGGGKRGARDADPGDLFGEVIAVAYEKHWTAWCGYARRIMWLEDPAFGSEDLVNHAVTATVNARPPLTGHGEVDAYVRPTMRSIYGKWLAKRLRLPSSVMSLDGKEPVPDLSDPGSSPDRQAFQHERGEQLRELLKQHIRPAELEVFVLHEVHGWKVDAIAERRGVHPETVRRWIRKVRKLISDNVALWGSG